MTLRRTLLSLLTLFALSLPTGAQSLADRVSRDVNRLLADEIARDKTVAVSVVHLNTGQTLVRHRDRAPMMPASNLKLVVGWAAMEALGPDFAFETVLAHRPQTGELIVFGGGDPALGDSKLTDRADVPVTWMFDRWAAALHEAGITQAPRLIVDDSVFEAPSAHPSWDPEQALRWYQAEVGGLNFHTNCFDIWSERTSAGTGVRVRPALSGQAIENDLRLARGKEKDVVGAHRPADSNDLRVFGTVREGVEWPVHLTMHDPGMVFGDALATHLRRHAMHGVEVDAVQRERARQPDGALPPDVQSVAIFRTPVTQVMARSNQQSQNLYAECLLKALSAFGRVEQRGETVVVREPATTRKPSGVGSWQGGELVVDKLLTRAKLSPATITCADGSGLSRDNRVTAEAMTSILARAMRQPYREDWLATLATSGMPGSTISAGKRPNLATDALKGRVYAKTGYIHGVSCLSGYVYTDDGQWAAFSVLCNDVPRGKTWEAKLLQDKIVIAIHEALETLPPAIETDE